MSVGTRLKKARKSLGLTIEDIQDKSKIKKSYLKAMENDNFEKLPGNVYTKVYIRGYAKIVGLDPQEILAEYTNKNGKNSDEEVKGKDKKVKKKNKKKNKKKKENLTKSDKLLRSIIGIILILILVLLSYNMFFRSDQNQNNTAISNQNSEVVEQESSSNSNVDSNSNNEEENNQTEVEETENKNVVVKDSKNENISEEVTTKTESEVENNNQQENNSEGQQPIIKDNTKEFKIIATDKSWLQVTIDDDLKFQGFIDEDETMTHNGEETVTLKIGNGVAVQVEINGEVLGPFGKRGEVIIKQFDLN
ncbi:MAG: DUF4115 domain-containing protein [Halanaerobiales bacterium]|nr:DUF4115 domain-containing protein [Halanaerobiales bacterium]